MNGSTNGFRLVGGGAQRPDMGSNSTMDDNVVPSDISPGVPASSGIGVVELLSDIEFSHDISLILSPTGNIPSAAKETHGVETVGAFTKIPSSGHSMLTFS